MLTAIIVAGGSSRRMGFDKTFALLAGQPVIAHSIAAFEQTESVAQIVVVGRADRVPELVELVRQHSFRKVAAVILGGARRQDSVANGLAQLGPETDFVAVHDAARPLVTPALIERIYVAARAHGGAASAAPVSDTLKRVNAECEVIGTVDRENLFGVQTPQIFRRDLLEKSYRAITEAALEITDEIAALEQQKEKVVLLPNEEPNFKITYPADLVLAELLLRQRAKS